MNKQKGILERIYQKLYDDYGPQHWWPGNSAFEIIIGAILTQNTAWRNAEKAINNLKQHKALSVAAIKNIPVRELAKLIKPAGYYNQKAKKLKNFIRFLFSNYQGNIRKMQSSDLDLLRMQLLEVNGIGPETADSILLYAAAKPIFVVDAYTRRVLSRHNLISPQASYDEIQNYFMSNMDNDVKMFNEYHALIVRLGKQVCKTKPQCEACPLKEVI